MHPRSISVNEVSFSLEVQHYHLKQTLQFYTLFGYDVGVPRSLRTRHIQHCNSETSSQVCT